MSVSPERRELLGRIICGILMLVIFQPIIYTCDTDAVEPGDWQILFWFGFVLILTSQISTTPAQFFTGSGIVILDWLRSKMSFLYGSSSSDNNGKTGNLASTPESALATKEVGFWTLMPSAFITWIFAKSIQNASVLGAAFGILGSIAYAAWYVSFFSASIVIYYLRTRHNSSSLPATIQHLYGPIAQVLFCLGLLYRLNNEVWSNALVVAGFYGEVKSGTWWLAAIFSSVIPGIYVFLGGMRSSLVSDVAQAFVAVVFLIVILFVISARSDYDPHYEPEGGWVLENGWQLLATALIQGTISYPFHDPVLTDRCYLSSPGTMLISFLVGGGVSMVFITLFGIIGIYGKSTVDSGLPADIGSHLGPVAFTLMNLVFMTSSMSTLDSTFTSTSKIIGLDVGGWFSFLRDDETAEPGPLTLNDVDAGRVNRRHVLLGRVGIVLMVVAGILPLLEETEALNATLVSGTTVMGLGPPIYLALFWRYGNGGWRRSPLSFIFSFVTGVVYGALYQARDDFDEDFPEDLRWGVDFGFVGSYTTLLGCNVWGHIICFIACALGFVLDQYVLKFGEFIEMEQRKDASATQTQSGDKKVSGEQMSADIVEGGHPTKPKPIDRVMTVESNDGAVV